MIRVPGRRAAGVAWIGAYFLVRTASQIMVVHRAVSAVNRRADFGIRPVRAPVQLQVVAVDDLVVDVCSLVV